MAQKERIVYPRKRLVRRALRQLATVTLHLLCDFRVIGRENLPEKGPMILVANHFHFGDVAAIVSISPWPVEFIGDTTTPNAPVFLSWIRKLWGYILIRRGGASLQGLRKAIDVLDQDGVLFVAPEAGSWAPVLRPARPGAAFLATQSDAPLLPIGLDGLNDIFPRLRQGRRARVTVRIGQPFGPFQTSGRGQERRRQLDQIGHEIMRQIALLIPPERRGIYSRDAAVREATKDAANYPWSSKPAELDG
ncbi:MAG: lysophospholipid acyltransferase family protein [Candidatus Promineifilaceae bacterium]|nr:lysophospholipid acyltransferase family protein [Candidatus Promineifilaceae bacterium]